MNPRHTRTVATVLMALLAVSTGCVASGVAEPSPNEVPSTDLVEMPGSYDGDEVTFTGEAIGEAMRRGTMAWLHLNDDAYYRQNTEEGALLGGYNAGMAVWIPAGLTDPISHFGNHANEGDIVRVTGTFNAACAQHGGDMDIHAASLDVVTPGHAVREPVDQDKAAWALALAVVAVGVFAADRFRARQALDAGR